MEMRIHIKRDVREDKLYVELGGGSNIPTPLQELSDL
jgi:hypothetical protein